jgi:hypothetical protein
MVFQLPSMCFRRAIVTLWSGSLTGRYSCGTAGSVLIASTKRLIFEDFQELNDGLLSHPDIQ